jgi:hypothetical protein
VLFATYVATLVVYGLVTGRDLVDTNHWFVSVLVPLWLGFGIAGGVTSVVAMVKGERWRVLIVPLVSGVLCALVLAWELFEHLA